MFNIGDKVVSKKTGLPAIGTVVGILTASIYCHISRLTILSNKQVVNGQGESCFITWNKLYPDWTEHMVYFLKLPQPQRTYSFAEFLTVLPADLDLEIAKKIYKERVGEADLIAYPEADLELFETTSQHV